MIFLLVMALLVIFTVIIFTHKIYEVKRLPPGPWGFPILGHLPVIGFQPHKKLLTFQKKYGPIIFIRFGSMPTIILQDAKIIKEAFVNQIFAGRPKVKVIMQASNQKGVTMSEGTVHTEQRQFIQKFLKDLTINRSESSVKIHEDIQALCEFLKWKKNKFVSVSHLFHNYVVNTLWMVVLSEKFDYNDQQIGYFAHLITTRLSGRDRKVPHLAILWPWLGKWFPELSRHNDMVSAFNELFDYMESRINQRKLTWVKDQPRDFTDKYFDKVVDTKDLNSSFHAKNEFQKYTTAELFMTATDTVSASLEWFLLCMAKNPAVQSKFQEEVDKIVGQNCLPNLTTHQPHCPYVEASLNELLRFSTVVPLGLFHGSLAPVEFHKYKIPARTTVVANLWGVHHDPEVWGDPQNFRPERFLGEEGKKLKMDHLLAFSYGKRICLGERLAKDQLFLFTTSLCQKFTILLNPRTTDKDLNPQFGFSLTPPKFQVKFVERV